MPKCTLNGKEIEVAEGTTIIEAYKKLEEDIAHYCWHPGLSVAGVCRLCMVKVEGNPRLQIACNTVVQDGMVISNQDDEVKEAVRWGLDFHLINHPLDCPVCDQAGECGLQDQYMKFGKYDPEMAERKVKKSKVVDLGKRVVLDSERCILCSRCVRFTEEVSKTNELGIFNRGDHSEIGTYSGKPLDNNYSLNTVDICPVGALTSRDFRFKQRVWFLNKKQSVCTGCSTGCNIDVYFNTEGGWRFKPAFNAEVNGHWMCDKGRDYYANLNPYETHVEGERKDKKVKRIPVRLLNGMKGSEMINSQDLATEVGQKLKELGGEKVALVITGQQTSEELEAVTEFFAKDLNSKNVFYWVNNKENFDEFDGILKRGDENPNTKGALKTLEKFGLNQTWSQLTDGIEKGHIEMVLVLGPENQQVYPDFKTRVEELSKVKTLVWTTACLNESLDKSNVWQIPANTFVEKEGTFINHAGLEQKISFITDLVHNAFDGVELARLMRGEDLPEEERFKNSPYKRVDNEFTSIRGDL